MKNYILILTLLLASPWAMSQSDFKLDPATTEHIGNALIECIYNYTINAPLKDNINKTQKEVYTTILQTNGSVSKFWDWHTYKMDSILYTSDPALNLDSLNNQLKDKYNYSVANIFDLVILKNHQKGKFTVTDHIVPIQYRYEEPKTNLNWTIVADTSVLFGYLCQKAYATYGGREWIVWFTPEIPISDGPWKLHGLPGLILKAHDKDNTHQFEAIRLRQSISPIYSNNDRQIVTTRRKTFIKNKNSFEKDPQSYIPKSEPLMTTHDAKLILVRGLRTNILKETIFCPLELE
jgi:GLPGLI family protein